MALPDVQKRSVGDASLIGIGVGVVVLALYVVGGIVVAKWGVSEFFARLTVEIVGGLLFAGALAVAVFAIPVAAYLRYRVVSPLVVLLLVIVAWLAQGFATGVLSIQTVFGLALYAMYLSPLYVVLYVVVGWVEVRVRN